MDDSLLSDLAAALAAPDELAVLGGLRTALGSEAAIAVWHPTRDGWERVWGDELAFEPDAPSAPSVVREGTRALLRVGDDPTASRLVVLDAPALPGATLDAVARLLAVALGRHVEREIADNAQQRLADNERIGQLGSYDWHVPTDTNRWSDQLYRIYGEEPQSFNASYERFMSFIHPDDRDKVAAIHQQAFATGEPYEMEERIVLADGTERLLWSNGEVIPGPDGQPEHFIGLCRDVTDQRAAEREAAAAEHLRQQAHEAGIRRRAALELNDVVLQGLTATTWAMDTGAVEVARDLLDQTLDDARRMMDDLLLDGGGRAPDAGQLRRTDAPSATITPESVTNGTGNGQAPTAGGAAPRRVVLADDAPDVRLLLALQLRQLGVEVVGEAENGRQAVALVAEHAPDVVLLDLAMPVMDGLEATRAIRSAHPDVTIVVLSGYGQDTMAASSLAAGADAYVEKGAKLSERLGETLGLAAA